MGAARVSRVLSVSSVFVRARTPLGEPPLYAAPPSPTDDALFLHPAPVPVYPPFLGWEMVIQLLRIRQTPTGMVACLAHVTCSEPFRPCSSHTCESRQGQINSYVSRTVA